MVEASATGNAVLYEKRGPVALITINQPQKRNALSASVREGLRSAFESFERDSLAKVAILTATGEQAFCAGMDLKEASVSKLKIPPRGPGGVPVIGDDLVVTKPTIAAVNGVAVAGGWLIAQMCDLCVAADHATFGITEARVGRGTPWAVPLINMLPQRVVLELLMTGQLISARRLYELGYVNRLAPLSSLMDEAMALALQISANAPLTVRACREMVYLSTEMGRSKAMKSADDLFAPVYLSEDAQEGPKAFSEKRTPVWKGK
ncbi:MAG: enoyl-CoA hydratase-related protein [Lautropia sp.]